MGAPLVVLVRPSLPENLGAAARNMAAFGLSELRLVAPEALPDHPQARAVATHGVSILENARVFDSLAEAVADCHSAWGTTARTPEAAPQGPRAAAAAWRAEVGAGRRVALVFGPERTGLSRAELGLCTSTLRFPTRPECPALNLGQAVGLCAWEWAAAEPADPPPGPAPAPLGEQHALVDALVAALDRVGYFPASHREPMVRHLRAFFLRAAPGEQEVRTLRGVVRALGR